MEGASDDGSPHFHVSKAGGRASTLPFLRLRTHSLSFLRFLSLRASKSKNVWILLSEITTYICFSISSIQLKLKVSFERLIF